MKKNMKKLAALLFMAMLVLGLTACGSTEKTADLAVDSAYAESISEFVVANMTMMSAEEMQYYVDMEVEDFQAILDNSGIPSTAEAMQNVFSSFMSSTDDLGEYISTGDYTLDGDKEETTMTTKLVFSEHEANMVLIFDEDGIVTTTTLDPVYSIGEILQKAALNTVIGMGTVFVVLIFISFIIALLPKLTAIVEGKGKKAASAPAPKTENAPVAAPVVKEELADDLELVAVISAAIAAYTGTSSDDFVVRSIKRSTSNKWKKA